MKKFSILSFTFLLLPFLVLVNHSQTLAQRSSTAEINRSTLRTGSQGVEVFELQAALKLLGYYNGPVNGVYGDSTARAVSLFQQAAGLKPDGIVGTATWRRLFPATPAAVAASSSSDNSAEVGSFPVPSTTRRSAESLDTSTRTASTSPVAASSQPKTVEFPILRLGMEGPAVSRLQERLRTLGFYKDSVDGVFGVSTQAAVKAAQQRFKLSADGIVGAATWSALLR